MIFSYKESLLYKMNESKHNSARAKRTKNKINKRKKKWKRKRNK